MGTLPPPAGPPVGEPAGARLAGSLRGMGDTAPADPPSPADPAALEAPELVLTGERTLPGIPDENYWYRRHEAAYLATSPRVRDAVVLEAGCGEGYGAALLARTATRVLAVDRDEVVARHARMRYPQLTLVRAELDALPLSDAAVDAVVSLQVIEHLDDQPAFLAECARVLRAGGLLVLSTPNRLTFSPGGEPLNPFHTRELSAGELTELTGRAFETVLLAGLHHGARLRHWEAGHAPLPAAQLAGAPPDWPDELRRMVHSVRATDFCLRTTKIDESLDLFSISRRRR